MREHLKDLGRFLLGCIFVCTLIPAGLILLGFYLYGGGERGAAD